MNSSEIKIINCQICAGTGMGGDSMSKCPNCGGEGVIGTDGQFEYLVQIDRTSGKPTVIGIKPPMQSTGGGASQKTQYLGLIFIIVMLVSLSLVTLITYLFEFRILALVLGGITTLIFAIFIITLILRFQFLWNFIYEPRDFIWVLNQKRSMKR